MKSLVIISVLYHYVAFVRGDSVQHMKIDRNEKKGGNVEFKNCVERDSPIQLISLEIIPQPIRLGKGENNVFITAVINVTKPIGVAGQRVSGDVSLKIKDGTNYIELCRLFKWGTCHINDFCQWLNHYKDKTACVYAAVLGFHCSCPVPEKTYVFTNLSVPVRNVDLVIHGAFELLVALKDDVSVLGCVDLKLCVNTC